MSIERALATGSLALNALVYTLIDGMTLTPGKAPGGYLAFFSMDQTFSAPASGSASLRTQIFENGVGIDHSVRRLDDVSWCFFRLAEGTPRTTNTNTRGIQWILVLRIRLWS